MELYALALQIKAAIGYWMKSPINEKAFQIRIWFSIHCLQDSSVDKFIQG
jgi:hypothetical protein